VFNPFRVEARNPFSRSFCQGDRYRTGALRLAQGAAPALEFIAFSGTDAFRARFGLGAHQQEERARARGIFNQASLPPGPSGTGPPPSPAPPPRAPPA